MDGQPLALKESTSLLKSKSFRRLWVAQFAATTAIYALNLSSVILVEGRTHSSAKTGLVVLSAILPAFLASLVAGAVVDRRGRAQSLIASHFARSLAALGFWVATSFLPPALALLAVYTTNTAMASFSQFAQTSELALLPELVEPERLMSANALYQLGMLAAEGLGVVVLGPLVVKLAGTAAVGLFGFSLCLLALLLVLGLPKDDQQAGPTLTEQSVGARLRIQVQAGWQTIAQDRLLTRVVIQATLAAAFLIALLTLVPGLATRHLGLGVENAFYLMLPGGAGFVVGSILISRRGTQLNRPRCIALGLSGVGLSTVLLALVAREPGRLWLAGFVILILGLMLALIVIPARTILQDRPPPALRGRVIAAQLALANAASVVFVLLGGSSADQIGIRPVMAVLGVLALAVGLANLRGSQGINRGGI